MPALVIKFTPEKFKALLQAKLDSSQVSGQQFSWPSFFMFLIPRSEIYDDELNLIMAVREFASKRGRRREEVIATYLQKFKDAGVHE